MTDATTMTSTERDRLTREIERIDNAHRRGKPVGLVSIIARHCRKPRYTIADINRMAAERGMSYGQMVLELEKGRERR